MLITISLRASITCPSSFPGAPHLGQSQHHHRHLLQLLLSQVGPIQVLILLDRADTITIFNFFFPRWAPSKSSSSWTEPTPSPSSSATSFRLVCVWICKQADIIPSTTQNLMKKLVFFFDQRLYIITCKYPPIRNKNLFCDNKLEMLK